MCQNERAPGFGERYDRSREAEWENEGNWGRPDADQRAQWNYVTEGHTYENSNQPWVSGNAENWVLNKVSWKGKNDFFVPLNNSSSRLSFCRGIIQFWTSNQQQTKFSLPTRDPRNREIWKKVNDQSKKFDKNSTVVHKSTTFRGIVLFHQDFIIYSLQFVFGGDLRVIILSSGWQKILRRDIFGSREKTSIN